MMAALVVSRGDEVTDTSRQKRGSIFKALAALVLALIMLVGTAVPAEAKTYYHEPYSKARYSIPARKWYQSPFKLKQKKGTAVYRGANGTCVNVGVYGEFHLVIREYKNASDRKGTVVYQGYWRDGSFTYKTKVGKTYTCDMEYLGKARGNVLIGPLYYVRMAKQPQVGWV